MQHNHKVFYGTKYSGVPGPWVCVVSLACVSLCCLHCYGGLCPLCFVSLVTFPLCAVSMVTPLSGCSAAFNQGKQEITFPAGQPRYCFEGLSQDALYTATVFVQTPNLEGPGVSGKERTRESPVGTGGRTPPPVPARPQRAGVKPTAS